MTNCTKQSKCSLPIASEIGTPLRLEVGEAVYSRYNAPFTPWFLRRNKIWLHLGAAP